MPAARSGFAAGYTVALASRSPLRFPSRLGLSFESRGRGGTGRRDGFRTRWAKCLWRFESSRPQYPTEVSRLPSEERRECRVAPTALYSAPAPTYGAAWPGLSCGVPSSRGRALAEPQPRVSAAAASPRIYSLPGVIPGGVFLLLTRRQTLAVSLSFRRVRPRPCRDGRAGIRRASAMHRRRLSRSSGSCPSRSRRCRAGSAS